MDAFAEILLGRGIGMKHNLWYRIVRWLIQHSTAAMTYVIEMRNEVADGYEYKLRLIEDRLDEILKEYSDLLEGTERDG